MKNLGVFILLFFSAFLVLAQPQEPIPVNPWNCLQGDHDDLLYIDAPFLSETASEVRLALDPLTARCENGKLLIIDSIKSNPFVASYDIDRLANADVRVEKQTAQGLTRLVLHLPPRNILFADKAEKTFQLDIGFLRTYSFKVTITSSDSGALVSEVVPLIHADNQ